MKRSTFAETKVIGLIFIGSSIFLVAVVGVVSLLLIKGIETVSVVVTKLYAKVNWLSHYSTTHRKLSLSWF